MEAQLGKVGGQPVPQKSYAVLMRYLKSVKEGLIFNRYFKFHV